MPTYHNELGDLTLGSTVTTAQETNVFYSDHPTKAGTERLSKGAVGTLVSIQTHERCGLSDPWCVVALEPGAQIECYGSALARRPRVMEPYVHCGECGATPSVNELMPESSYEESPFGDVLSFQCPECFERVRHAVVFLRHKV